MIYKECFGKVQILINTFSKKYPELRRGLLNAIQ